MADDMQTGNVSSDGISFALPASGTVNEMPSGVASAFDCD